MLWHSPAIMGNQNAALARGALEQFRISNSFQTGTGGSEIDTGFSLADCSDDALLQVGICLEANTRARGSPIFARARCNLSQSAGSACFNGMPLASNSRSVPARYSPT
jgi:hypothetical protein